MGPGNFLPHPRLFSFDLGLGEVSQSLMHLWGNHHMPVRLCASTSAVPVSSTPFSPVSPLGPTMTCATPALRRTSFWMRPSHRISHSRLTLGSCGSSASGGCHLRRAPSDAPPLSRGRVCCYNRSAFSTSTSRVQTMREVLHSLMASPLHSNPEVILPSGPLLAWVRVPSVCQFQSFREVAFTGSAWNGFPPSSPAVSSPLALLHQIRPASASFRLPHLRSALHPAFAYIYTCLTRIIRILCIWENKRIVSTLSRFLHQSWVASRPQTHHAPNAWTSQYASLLSDSFGLPHEACFLAASFSIGTMKGLVIPGVTLVQPFCTVRPSLGFLPTGDLWLS